MPVALRTGAAASAVRKRISSRAASGSRAPLPTPAAKPIQVCSAFGIGLTSSTPGTPEIRDATTTRSTSPRPDDLDVVVRGHQPHLQDLRFVAHEHVFDAPIGHEPDQGNQDV